jgi:hypothetical protein
VLIIYKSEKFNLRIGKNDVAQIKSNQKEVTLLASSIGEIASKNKKTVV